MRDLQAVLVRMQQLQAELAAAKSKLDDYERTLIPGLRSELRDSKLAAEELSRRVRELDSMISELRQWEPKYSQLKIEFDR